MKKLVMVFGIRGSRHGILDGLRRRRIERHILCSGQQRHPRGFWSHIHGQRIQTFPDKARREPSVQHVLAYTLQLRDGHVGPAEGLQVLPGQNADCSNPVLVQNNDAGAAYMDFMLKPTIYSGAVAAGTYNCMIVEASDLIKFTTGTNAGAITGGVCNDGATYTFDAYKTENPLEHWYDIVTGSTTTGNGSYTGAVDQTVTFFMSTGVTPRLGDPLKSDGTAIRNAPGGVYSSVLDQQAIQLLNPIVITAGASTKAAFVVDPTGRVDTVNDGMGSGDLCWLEGATISFITQ